MWWYYDYSFSIYGPLGQHGLHWSRDRLTLTFDLGGHAACSWCGSSSSIRISSLKYVGLAIRTISVRVSISGPGDPDPWPFDLETGTQVASVMENLTSKFGYARPLGSRIIRYVHDGQTDGPTKATLIAPFPGVGGIIIQCWANQHQTTGEIRRCNYWINEHKCYNVNSPKTQRKIKLWYNRWPRSPKLQPSNATGQTLQNNTNIAEKPSTHLPSNIVRNGHKWFLTEYMTLTAVAAPEISSCRGTTGAPQSLTGHTSWHRDRDRACN